MNAARQHFRGLVAGIFLKALSLSLCLAESSAPPYGVGGDHTFGTISFSIDKPTEIDGLRSDLAIHVKDTRLVLGKDRIVKQIVGDEARNLALLLIYKIDSYGSGYYDRIISLRVSNGKLDIHEYLRSLDLNLIDGRERSVLEIGDPVRFPKVRVLMMTDERQTAPTKSNSIWEVWDFDKAMKSD
jgi:hypothetical protein